MRATKAARTPGTRLPYTFNFDADGWPLPRHHALELASTLRGSDDRTATVLQSLAHTSSPAAFYTALESLRYRRTRRPRLTNEAGYFVNAVKDIARCATS